MISNKASDSPSSIHYLFWAVHNVAQYAFSFSYHSDQIWSIQRHTCNEEVTFSHLFFPRCLLRFILFNSQNYKSCISFNFALVLLQFSYLCKCRFQFSYLEQKLWESFLISLTSYPPSPVNPISPNLKYIQNTTPYLAHLLPHMALAYDLTPYYHPCPLIV